MVHLRIVVPSYRAEKVYEMLCETASAIDVICVPNASRRPDGDLILCDVAREDVSVIISELRDLGIHHDGSISISATDTISDLATAAVEHAPGSPADAVVLEELDQRTSESIELSAVFLLYMVLAVIIAAIGIFLDSPILVVGAMVVGPEFGPVAGVCVAIVQMKPELARRSVLALVVGFALAIGATVLATLAFDVADIVPDAFDTADHALSDSISSPDAFAFIVAALRRHGRHAQPLHRQVRRADRRPDLRHHDPRGRQPRHRASPTRTGARPPARPGQLGVNLVAILLAGTLTLYIQRLLYLRRKCRRLQHG